MKVYVCFVWEQYEGSRYIGVVRTLEEAKAKLTIESRSTYYGFGRDFTPTFREHDAGGYWSFEPESDLSFNIMEEEV